MNFYSSTPSERIYSEFLGKSCDISGEEYEFKDKIRVKIEITRNDKQIFYADFYNSILIPNLEFKKTKNLYNTNSTNSYLPAEKNIFNLDVYQILIYFDMTEIPNWIRNSISHNNEFISWIIRIQSNNLLKFCLDTLKEDKENYIKQCWENKDPGRKERAKNARKYYLISKKIERGGDVTAEEQLFYDENHITIKARNKNNKRQLEIRTDYDMQTCKTEQKTNEIESYNDKRAAKKSTFNIPIVKNSCNE